MFRVGPAPRLMEEYRGCAGGGRAGPVTVAGGKHILSANYVGLGCDGSHAPPIDVAEFI